MPHLRGAGSTRSRDPIPYALSLLSHAFRVALGVQPIGGASYGGERAAVLGKSIVEPTDDLMTVACAY